jgi:AraC-like DNA-binding protein
MRHDHPTRSIGEGLERSCSEQANDWMCRAGAAQGVELLEACFRGRAYRKHRHDTYAIGLTDSGDQTFDYRGATHVSRAGNIIVLHPDEAHDGRAGSDAGFCYRMLYIEPSLIFDAIPAVTGRRGSLPFARQPVIESCTIAQAIQSAFEAERAPLAIDDLVVEVTEGLIRAAEQERPPLPRHLALDAVERARQFLDAERHRVVDSAELERVTGMPRYELARHFRARVGTSPYRYSSMRRLALARELIGQRRPLVEVALETGFADQAHFTRKFTDAFGMTPARYRALLQLPRFEPAQAGAGVG